MKLYQFPLLSILFFCTFISTSLFAQNTTSSPEYDSKVYDIIENISTENVESHVRKLADFGTRHTLSDTISETRGIGAARRWIKAEFDKISKDCDGCLEVYYQRNLLEKGANQRIIKDVWVVNVIAVLKGTQNPNSYAIMSGDIDSRASDVTNFTIDAPGANDNATGVAGILEAARVLSKSHSKNKFKNSIAFAALSGEEQGLFGGKFMAEQAKKDGWDIIGVINNDMIGNIEGIDGVIDNRSFRIFSEPTPVTETEKERNRRRYYGGEIDGISRQLARYIHSTTKKYMPEMNPTMIYRLDRFGRGGHHRPFNDAGFAGVRIMESHENYNRQHQDIREENGIKYGDVVEGVNFEYLNKLTAVNAIVLANLGWSPLSPQNVKIGGAVQPSTTLSWDKLKDEDSTIVGYKIYWRETTAPQWQYARFVPKEFYEEKTEEQITFVLENIVIDNYLFGVAAVDENGHESIVSFPREVIR
ncbi:M28 family metallopeptidase [Bernardetia sp.]|uniref:M28 family metallopeptidase n=1 Tax=Bernardetia sp. TaxID=1937974 RepID=UPI0025B8E28A|nr:M28 family metallopeptidase [Bernardetia sp.]